MTSSIWGDGSSPISNDGRADDGLFLAGSSAVHGRRKLCEDTHGVGRDYHGWTRNEDRRLRLALSEVVGLKKTRKLQLSEEVWDGIAAVCNNSRKPEERVVTGRACGARWRHITAQRPKRNFQVNPAQRHSKKRYCWQTSELEQLIKFAFERASERAVKPWLEICRFISKPDLDSNKCKCELTNLITKYSQRHFSCFRELFSLMDVADDDTILEVCRKKYDFVRLPEDYKEKLDTLFAERYSRSFLMLQWEIFVSLWKKTPLEPFKDVLQNYENRFNSGDRARIPAENDLAEIEHKEALEGGSSSARPSDLANPLLICGTLFGEEDTGKVDDPFGLMAEKPFLAGVEVDEAESMAAAETLMNQPVDYGNV